MLLLMHLFASVKLKPISLQGKVELKRITTFPLEQCCPNLWPIIGKLSQVCIIIVLGHFFCMETICSHTTYSVL